MANWALPSLTSAYTNFVTEVSSRDVSCALWFNSATVTDTNVPAGAVRWNNTDKNWDIYSGGTWTTKLSATYGISITGYSTHLAGGNNTTLLGSIPYQSNTNSTTLLSPNTTTTKKFLIQTGTGTNGAAPVWDTIVVGDVSGAAPLSSPNFTGTPSLPTGTTGITQTVGDNSTKLATTAFVLANGTSLSDGTPLINGMAAAGNGTAASRWNHVHPTDTGRAATNQTFYIGTTQLAINRASGALALTGITSIDGSSASCTGNAATANYATTAGSAGLPPITYVLRAGVNGMFCISDGILYHTSGNAGYWQPTDNGINTATSFSHGLKHGWKKIILPYAADGAIVKHVGGAGFSFALMTNGNLYAWGDNTSGQLGLGHTTNANNPTLSHTGVSDIWCTGSSYSISHGFSFLRTTAGALKSCGSNYQGNLGVGDTLNKSSWTTISTFTGLTVTGVWITGGGYPGGTSFVQTSTNNIYAAGYNGQGGLGITPASGAVTTFTNVTTAWGGANQIKDLMGSSGYHSGVSDATVSYVLMLFANGALRTCGHNSVGECGDGTTTDRSVPYLITASGAKEIMKPGCYSSGYLHDNGSLYGWGLSANYNLGWAGTASIVTPTLITTGVSTILSPWNDTQYEGQYAVTLLRMNDGSTKVFGSNDTTGWYGNGATTPQIGVQNHPIPNIAKVGFTYTTYPVRCLFVVTDSGDTYAWGYNAHYGIDPNVSGAAFIYPTSTTHPTLC